MKILGTKKIILEDFPPEQQKWLPKLISPLNQFLESVYAILRRNITISDNLRAQVFRQNLPSNISTLELSWEFQAPPTLVLLGRLTTQAGAAVSTAPGFIWTYANGSINITLSGLASDTPHSITIVGII